MREVEPPWLEFAVGRLQGGTEIRVLDERLEFGLLDEQISVLRRAVELLSQDERCPSHEAE